MKQRSFNDKNKHAKYHFDQFLKFRRFTIGDLTKASLLKVMGWIAVSGQYLNPRAGRQRVNLNQICGMP
jgi:hypothetical protein